MEDRDFERVIAKSIESLPTEFKERLDNVDIVIADWPSREQLAIFSKYQNNKLLLGLYQGIPQTRRRNYGVGPTLPDKITLFKYPLLSISRSIEEAVNNISDTVIHELAHHFGISDEEIERIKGK